MADYIDRKRAANFLCKIICGSDRGLCVSTPENCRQKRMLEFFELPAADVVPVVRCNECKYHEIEPEKLKLGDIPPKQGECWCNCWDSAVNLSGFCSRGERIEE